MSFLTMISMIINDRPEISKILIEQFHFFKVPKHILELQVEWADTDCHLLVTEAYHKSSC